MVYINSWDDFAEKSVQMFRTDPEKVIHCTICSLFFFLLSIKICVIMYMNVLKQTRYVMKYRHSDGKLVLKVTDDKVVTAVFSPY